MGKYDNTFQNNKVYFPHAGDKLAFDSDGYLAFYDGNTITGDQLRTFLYTNQLYQVIAASAGKLSVINLPSGGTVIFSLSIGCSNMSAWLTSCLEGAKLFVTIRRNGMTAESVGSVFISLSGVSLVGLSGQDLSSISLHNSDGSAGYIVFVAESDNEWAVVERVQGKVVERPSA